MKRNTTGYKGVMPYKNRPNCWYAQITVQGKRIYLGFFRDAVKAAQAYDRAALEHFGPNWPINFPSEAPK